jgi:hypothetical protein
VVAKADGAAALAPPTSSLAELLGLLRRATVFIGCDSGPMHLASLARTPVVAIFGPTDPIENEPSRVPSRVVRSDVGCNPCREGAGARRCGRPAEAAEAALSLLARCPGPPGGYLGGTPPGPGGLSGRRERHGRPAEPPETEMATPALGRCAGRPGAQIAPFAPVAAPVLRGRPDRRLVLHDARPGSARRCAPGGLAREIPGSDPYRAAQLSAARSRFTSRAPAGRLRAAAATSAQHRGAPREESGRFVPTAMERYYLDLVRALGCPDTGTQLELSSNRRPRRSARRLAAAGSRAARLLVWHPARATARQLWPPSTAQVARAARRRGVAVHGPARRRWRRRLACRTGFLARRARAGSLLKSVLARAGLDLQRRGRAARRRRVRGAHPRADGPTSTGYTNLNLKRTKLLREPVECSPCQLKVCPIDHRCMTRLLPARVLAEARVALSQCDWRGSVDLELGA